MPWKNQKCLSCKTVFTDKIEIDTCPICRGKNIIRKDTTIYNLKSGVKYDRKAAHRNV